MKCQWKSWSEFPWMVNALGGLSSYVLHQESLRERVWRRKQEVKRFENKEERESSGPSESILTAKRSRVSV